MLLKKQAMQLPDSLKADARIGDKYDRAKPPEVGKCLSPVLIKGHQRACRKCTACAYAEAMRKCRLVESELDATIPSYFATFTYNDAAAREHLLLPAKPEGELCPVQEKHAAKIQRAIDRARAKFINAEESRESARYVDMLERRVKYHEARLERFYEVAEQAQPERLSIKRKEGDYWKERLLEILRETDPDAELPRMVVKHELGSRNSRRPHLHVLFIKPSLAELTAAIKAWGRYFIDPKVPRLPNWRELSELPEGRGHVHVLPVEARISTYITKDFYRGQDALPMEYIAGRGVEAPHISWPRRPAIGTGDWPEFIRRRHADNVRIYGPESVEVELALQDTRNPETSVRHRVTHVTPRGTRKPGQPVPTLAPQFHYGTCPPSVWQKFYAELKETRHRPAFELVKAFLDTRNSNIDSAPERQAEQANKAINTARRRLKAWDSICRAKGIELPKYAQREREFVAKRQRELLDLMAFTAKGLEPLRDRPEHREEQPKNWIPPERSALD